MLALLAAITAACPAAAAGAGCGASDSALLLDLQLEAAGYAEDHLNYLCSNWTRPTPLPCTPAVDSWQPRWGKRFMIFSWFQPLPSDYEAYADAGFNIALTRGDTWLDHMSDIHGTNWHATHDGMFDALVNESRQLADHGVLSVFARGPLTPLQMPRDTVAYGNATGGIVQGSTNLTTHTLGGDKNHFDTGDVSAWATTVPEVKWMLSEFARRNISHQFGGIFLHDDTVTQVRPVVAMATYLQEHAPWLIPIVNNVGGNSAPQSLYRSKLFIASPEQYPIKGCVNSSCTTDAVTPACLKAQTCMNASAGAASQQTANQDNAFQDMRYGLDHWPLFAVGTGNSPLSTLPNPDVARGAVRSDSLVRWMAYSAIAYGAKGLNYYGWGGGIYWTNDCGCISCAQMEGVHMPLAGCVNVTPAELALQPEYGQSCGCNVSQPGRPTPSYYVRAYSSDFDGAFSLRGSQSVVGRPH